jgi:prophage DNA circulation protein
MKLSILSAILLTTLVGCGEDVGSRRGSETVAPPIGLGGEGDLPSQLHRNRGLNVLTTRSVISLITSQALPAGYRTVPFMVLDDEGTNGKNIRTRSGLGRPAVNCGLTSGSTLRSRISECSTLNVGTSVWSGTSEGASGESTWTLVAKSGAQEVWQDSGTGNLWSDIVETTNWCNAAGNNLFENGASIDCSSFGTNFTCVGKTIMGLTGVIWRLPTRNDYLQGDLNGLRFVLRESDTTGFWTATMDSASATRSEAWVYQQKQGTLEKDTLTNDHQVRCIGAATTNSI